MATNALPPPGPTLEPWLPASSIGDAFPAPDVRHFVKAVTEFGQRRPVTTTCAIYNVQGLKVIEKGVSVDERLYDRLVAHRLATPIESSLASQPSVDATTLRDAAASAMDRIALFGLLGANPRVRDMLLEAIEGIALPPPVAFALTLTRETRPALFEHAILMALLSAHFVREGGGSVHDITLAAAAGLLHDLGMLYIDPGILHTEAALDPSQRNHLYAHPLTSAMLLQPHHVYPKEVVRGILEHHERLDGSGYPRGLAGDAISPLGRILGLAEVVTAMFGPNRPHPVARASLLLRVNPGRYDPALVGSMNRLLRECGDTGTAPAGAVALSEDDLAALRDRLARVPSALADWRALMDTEYRGATPRQQALLDAVTDQLDTLERMLFEAGAGPEQLAVLSAQDRGDPTLQVELSLLSREACWQLRMTALQLRRRWRGASASPRLPIALHQWIKQADVIDCASDGPRA